MCVCACVCIPVCVGFFFFFFFFWDGLGGGGCNQRVDKRSRMRHGKGVQFAPTRPVSSYTSVIC